MTRKKEIKYETGRRHDEICDAAFAYHCRWQNRPPEWRPDIATAFNDGAKWADAHPHWISVEDELPPRFKLDPNESNFVITYGLRIIITYYDYKEGEWVNNTEVTHWMPLPQAPKKGGGE